ncbi:MULTISPECIES: penicillin-binding protein activator [unclassified Vibrio]|uniref:Penicillin-binding protein activator n=1 Tax=Vibrio sp. HB236076 TaxID=3232307 RepID=A0AB39HCP0_9VIBR|nr:penicillin-binding protein activator [Vibrio sp. HB161653]MDP5254535.1 penicillin-binding protein activator [Vibrio sp. HB161653]
MMNHKKRSVPRLLSSVALAIALAACSSNPQQSEGLDISAQPTQSVESYMIKADSSEGSQQSDWLILAAKAALAQGDWPLTQRLLVRINRSPMTPVQNAEYLLTQGQLNLEQGNNKAVVDQLRFNAEMPINREQQRRYHTMRAQAFQNLGDAFATNRELVALSSYVDEQQQARLAEQIWNNFSGFNQQQLTELPVKESEDILDGWVQLAIYVNTLNNNLSQLQNTLKHWLAENSAHPAARYTPQDIVDILDMKIVRPKHTALLLPLTGKYAPQAKLIRDGFIFAMTNDQNRDPEASVSVIDTNLYSAAKIKQTLLENNIDFVVGPLTKDKVVELQQAMATDNTQIAALALNIPDQTDPGLQMCYLSLSPEQEASQAAKHLFKQGYRYPMIITPKGSFGQRVSQAFDKEWQKLSDTPVASESFGDTRSLQRDINKAFGLQDSRQRIALIERLVNQPLETQARSRRDVDAVYIVSRSSELTLIKPFIDVAVNPDAKPPKLFASSRSNDGSPSYEDLSNVSYSDIPLLITPDQNVKQQMSELWGQQSNMQKRLEALGMDAYSLLDELPQMKVVNGHTFQGQTGLLSLGTDCVIDRELTWSQFND